MELRGGKDVFFKLLKTTTNKSAFLHLGHISRSHGINGEVFISLLCIDSTLPDRLINKNIQIQKNDSIILNTKVLQVSCHKSGLIAKLEGIQSIEQVKNLVDFSVLAPKNLFVSASGQSIYLCEVDGFEVHDKSRNFLGKVMSFSSNGAQDLLKIQKGDTVSDVFEVPFIEPLITEVDFKTKKIFTALPSEWPDLDDE